MDRLLALGLTVYFIFYVFEGVIRYAFHLLGADSLIFIRDAFLIVPLMAIFAQQFLERRLHPAFFLFFLVILLHGTVMILNIGSWLAVIYSVKMLMTLVVGALAAELLFKPKPKFVNLLFVLWIISSIGVLLDKYFLTMPWMGLEATIGDVQVDVGRDWMVEGSGKRAGGLMRSSINVATVMPLIALLLMFNLKHIRLRYVVALVTAPVLVWSTQKGPILAYFMTLGFLVMAYKHPYPVLKFGTLFMMGLGILLPVAYSGMVMPQADGVFSFSSFYMRIEQMWPDAWRWISRNEAFPFGVGLGGISGAQRMYALTEMNAADNLFILLYAYFGVMSVVYLLAIAIVVVRAPARADSGTVHALSTLLFLFAYGVVISLLEDQMASLFMGAALAWLCRQIRERNNARMPVAGTELMAAR